MSSSYWVNPALFFKGDRVLFVNEYRRRKALPVPTQLEEAQPASLAQPTKPKSPKSK